MIDLTTLKPGRIYYLQSTKYRLPINIKDPMHGSVYTAISKTTDSMIQFFSNPLFYNQYLTKYFHEKIFSYRFYNTVIRYRIQDKEFNTLFETRVKSKFPNMALAFNVATLGKKNYLYDITELNERFFSPTVKDSHVGLKRVNEYFRLFKDVLDKVDSTEYNNKIIFIPIDEWIPSVKESSVYSLRNVNNFFSIFYQKLLNDPAFIQTLFLGWKVYFTFSNQIFTMDMTSLNKKSAENMRKFLMKVRNPGEKLQHTQDDDLDITPDDAATEAQQKTAMIDKVVDKFADVDVPLDYELAASIVEKSLEKSQIDLTTPDVNIDDIPILSPKELEIEQILAVKDTIVPKSQARLARETKMINEMKNLTLGNETLEEIQIRKAQSVIPTVDIPINTLNPNLQKMNFPEFDKAYMDNQFQQDIVRIFTNLQYKDKPLYLISSSVEDKSDKLNKVDEYTFKFEDSNGGRHTFQFLMPKMINNRFLKLSGNKKILINQLLPLPVTKTSPDTVQVASNYKKTFIKRFGQAVSPKYVGLIKGISASMSGKIIIQLGASLKANSKYITTMEYDELANKYKQLKVGNYEFFFDQSAIRTKLVELGYRETDLPDGQSNLLPIGIEGNKDIIYLNTDTNIIPGTDNKDFIDFIASKIDEVEPGFYKNIQSIKSGRKYMYSRATIMAKKVPLVLLLSYLDGLYTLMKKANINFRIVGKNEIKKKLEYIIGEEEIIEFEDSYLIYKIYPLRNTLLMNGFCEVPTKIYPISAFLSKEMYLEIFDTLFGRKNIGYAFENFKQLFTDPMTEDVLRDYNLPTDFVELLIYANALLEDNSYTDEGEMSSYRVRSNEMLVAFLYKVVAEAYENYRLTADNPNPTKFGAKKDAVILQILTNQVTQDASELSPQQVLENMRAITYKGPGGLNQDRAFNLSKRSFHPSMIGVLSQASPISGAIGIARTLTVDANVVSTRGYIKTTTNPDEVNNMPSTKLLSGAELATPFSPTSDEPEREAMLSAQTKHTISCVGSEPSLIGTGFEKTLPYLIGDNFVYKAKQNGKVTKIDQKNDAVIVKYDDGTYDIVNMNPEMGRNTGGGFYVSNRMVTNVNVGDKINKDSIIAYDPKYFIKDKRTSDLKFMIGPRARIAFVYSSKVFEDSGHIAKRLAKKMGSDIADKKSIALGINANIDYLVKKNQEVKVNDPLIIFDTSHEDELTNKILSKMKDADIADIMEASKTPIVSKHNGIIEDIKIYYSVPKERLSKSVQEIINAFEAENERRLQDITKDTNVDPNSIEISLIDVHQVKADASGKVKGTKLPNGEGVLIEIYPKYRAEMGIGDKLTNNVAIKAVVGGTWEEGEEPYLLSNPDDKIDAYVSVLSVGARLINSVLKISLGTNVLIGMKPNIKTLYEQIYGETIEEKKK